MKRINLDIFSSRDRNTAIGRKIASKMTVGELQAAVTESRVKEYVTGQINKAFKN